MNAFFLERYLQRNGVREGRRERERECLKLISTYGMSGVSELPQIAESKTELTTSLRAYLHTHTHQPTSIV